jgi:hypothetical protein
LLLQASTQEEAGDIAAASETLSAVAGNSDVPDMYRELASFKKAMLPTGDINDRRSQFQALSQPGEPFRLLALEQLAYLSLTEGDNDAALDLLRQIEEDASVTRGLRERVQSLMVAMGETLPDPVSQ